MKFNADSHFVIGGAHIKQNKPCQDHALHAIKNDGKAGIIVVSDGCSSGGHTDIGSRVITCSTLNALADKNLRVRLETHHTPFNIADCVRVYSNMAKTSLGIKDHDLEATCIYAIVNEMGGFIHIIGDGVAAIKYKDGHIELTTIEWQGNMPFYLVYKESGELERFINHHSAVSLGEAAVEVNEYFLNLNSNVVPKVFKRKIDIETAIKGHIIPIYAHELKLIDCVAIFSDGVQDFRKDNERQPLNEGFLEKILAFKNWKGDFVKRRIKKELSDLSREDITPNDDFSMAVLYFDNSEEINNEPGN